MQQARERLTKEELEAVSRLLNFSKSGAFETRWGTGKETGSFTIVELEFISKSIVSCFTNGSIVFNFGVLKGSGRIEKFRDELAYAAIGELGFSIPEDYIDRYPKIHPAAWIPKVDILIDIVTKLIDKYKAA